MCVHTRTHTHTHTHTHTRAYTHTHTHTHTHVGLASCHAAASKFRDFDESNIRQLWTDFAGVYQWDRAADGGPTPGEVRMYSVCAQHASRYCVVNQILCGNTNFHTEKSRRGAYAQRMLCFVCFFVCFFTAARPQMCVVTRCCVAIRCCVVLINELDAGSYTSLVVLSDIVW